MSALSSRHDLDAKSRALRDEGFCVLEQVLAPYECRAARESVLRYLDSPGHADVRGFGLRIFALFERLPALRAALLRGDVIALCERVLDDAPCVKQSVARVSGRQSDERIAWHHHHAWSAGVLARRERCERLGLLGYPLGTAHGAGPLLVVRRAFRDALETFTGGDRAPRADEVRLELPPGSVVVLDAAVMHSALRPTTDELRILFGAQVQGAHLHRAHAEDDPWRAVWRLRARRWLGREARSGGWARNARRFDTETPTQ